MPACNKYQRLNHRGPVWYGYHGRPLQESQLTFPATVAKCRTKEAAKKNRSQMIVQEQETKMIATLHNPQPGAQQRKSYMCPWCGGAQHKGGCIHCPMYDKVCSCCPIVEHFARVGRSKQRSHQQVPLNDNSQSAANAIRLVTSGR